MVVFILEDYFPCNIAESNNVGRVEDSKQMYVNLTWRIYHRIERKFLNNLIVIGRYTLHHWITCNCYLWRKIFCFWKKRNSEDFKQVCLELFVSLGQIYKSATQVALIYIELPVNGVVYIYVFSSNFSRLKYQWILSRVVAIWE